MSILLFDHFHITIVIHPFRIDNLENDKSDDMMKRNELDN